MLPDPQPGRLNLLGVLDWGLGHAARSLALADRLVLADERVIFAASGAAKAFLEKERPGLTCHDLPPYRVTYPSRSMPLNVARQLPRWLSVIYRERRQTAELVATLGVDRVISDNRFGCYSSAVPSILLTHQLHPITHNRAVSFLYRSYLQRFTEYWVPDFDASEQRISGRLSRAEGYRNVKYVGLLSRLRPPAAAEPIDVLALLSGPEPMRSQLEVIVLRQLRSLPGQHVLVRGLPAAAAPLSAPGNVRVYDFADADLLPRLLVGARTILCRSGYSSLMDVLAVTDPKKLYLVPTPGQTEQEYLAERMGELYGCRHALNQETVRLDGVQ